MNLTRCSNGHFYDADINSSCPHCQNAAQAPASDVTVAVQRSVDEDSVTQPLTTASKIGVEVTDSISQIPDHGVTIGTQDDVKTISYTQKTMGKEPVVGWFVCIEGAHKGEDFKLKTGKNFIGRLSSMDVALKEDTSVSREKHAIILYEPKTHIFLVQPGEARELCYLNDAVVLTAQEIKRNDVLSVGESKLMFFPCCDETFNWDMVEKKDEKVGE